MGLSHLLRGLSCCQLLCVRGLCMLWLEAPGSSTIQSQGQSQKPGGVLGSSFNDINKTRSGYLGKGAASGNRRPGSESRFCSVSALSLNSEPTLLLETQPGCQKPSVLCRTPAGRLCSCLPWNLQATDFPQP